MKVLMAGSSHLVADREIGLLVLAVLRELPAEVDTILLRRPRGELPSSFERLIATLANALDMDVTWFRPGEGGRSATFLRDVQMVSAADEVIAFFPDGEEMTGGTGHVVDKALDQGVPVRAYAVTEAGLRWIGGTDKEGP